MMGHYYKNMNKIESLYEEFLQKRQNQGLKRDLIDITRPNFREIHVNGQNYLNFSSNDYLGLSQHPDLIARAQDWAKKYGAGSAASRLVTGNLDIFTKIEDKIATFKNREAALIMVSGFQANVSILPALFDKESLGQTPLVFSDKLNHASMHLGCKAANILQIRYRHNDMNHLKELLEKHGDNQQSKFILTESVFSMDGDIAPLDEIDTLAKQHNCFVIVDEAHATGVLGERGKGLADKADLVIGTFSKAFGAFGAYVACSKNLKEYLVNKCGGIIYATALPPSVLGSIDAALDLIPNMDSERAHLQNIAQNFRNELSDLGYECGDSKTQIVPLMIGDANEAIDLGNELKSQNIWATAIRPPTVPNNTARLRFAFSSLHTQEDIEKLITILKSTHQKKIT
jgi:8-amino-7-oxononanoate synthase